MGEKTFNRVSIKEKRKKLRKSQTEPEKIFWKQIRGKKFLGLKFYRQYDIGEYIADFYCPKLRLVVEIERIILLKRE